MIEDELQARSFVAERTGERGMARLDILDRELREENVRQIWFRAHRSIRCGAAILPIRRNCSIMFHVKPWGRGLILGPVLVCQAW